MREEDVTFMSGPCLPHPSPPSSSDLSGFPSFPVINYNSSSSHDSASTVTNSDFSSASPLISHSMAPQDSSSTSEPASSSLSSLNCSSQNEYFPSAYCQDSSVTYQDACSPIPPKDHSSIHDYTHCTSISMYSSKSQMESSTSSLLNGASTFLTSTHSLSSGNNSSTSQLASSPSSKSPVDCSCQPEYLSTSCQNSMSISQTTYSYRSFQNGKSISEQTKSDCSSIEQMNDTFTSRTDDHSVSHLEYSSAYIIPPIEDPRDFSPVSSSSTLNHMAVNQYAKTTQECHVKALSNDSSLVSSIFPVDIPCICTYELPNDFSSGISSSHLNEHESSYTLQSQNYFDLSSNMASINDTPHVNTTTNPCSKCTSTNHHNTDFDPFTPLSTQSFHSPKIPETDVVSTNDKLSVGHSLVNGHDGSHLPTKSTYSFSFPNSVDRFPSFDTPPVQGSTCPSSADDTAFTSTHEKHPKMFPSCLHASPYATTPKHTPFSKEENQVQESEVWQASLENKVRMDQDRQLCERFLDSLSRFEDWLQIAQITTSQGNRYKTLHQEAKLALRKYEVLLTEMREKLLDLESLNRQYWRLTQTPQQTLLPCVLRSRMQEVNTLWNSLQGEAETLHKTFKSRVQQREQFETDQDDMKLCLTEMDLELSNVEYIYGGNSAEKIQQLKAFQEDVWSNMKKVEGLLERGDQLIDSSDPRDAADLEVEMTELGSYCQQIFIRLSRLQKRLVSTKLVFEDDFLDSAIEHLSSGSSDVFLDLDIEDRETSSPVNVPVTSAALPVDLEWDPLGDVGRSSSHDGQESFYTATSAPWKRLQRSDGSQSSLSSYSGITYPIMTRQEDKETLGDIHTNHSPPSNICDIEWAQEQIDSHGLVENSLVQPSSPLEIDKGQDITCSSVFLATDEPDAKHKSNIPYALTGYYGKAADPDRLSHEEMIDNQSQSNRSGQTRRQRKKKRMVRNQDTKETLKPAKPDVSILMENGDDLRKSYYRPPCSPCLWIRRLALASVLLLVLVTSLLFPWGPQTGPSRCFSWSVMLTYVNGPPPT